MKGIDDQLRRLQKRLGETAEGNTRQRDAIESRMDMLRDKAGYKNDLADGIEQSFKPQPQRDLERRLANLEAEIKTIRAERPPFIYPARKTATPAQFTELTVPATGTTLAPMVSGGRAATADTDPVVPLDLGADDSVLLEIPMPGQMRTVRIAGGGVKRVRYIQTPIHAFQQTFKQNPTVDADWETIVELDPCSTTAPRTGNIFNPLGLGSDENIFEETFDVNLAGVATTTVQITTGDTSTNGAGSTQLVDYGTSGPLYRIEVKAIGSTKKGQIRIFYSTDAGTTKHWIGEIQVPATEATGIAPTWEGIWEPRDKVNGFLMAGASRIYVSTYETDTFNVTAIGAEIA